MSELSRIAYFLALIGGILLVVFGLLSLIGYSIGGFPFLYWSVYSFAYGSIISIICGVIIIVGSRSVATLVWAIVIIILGLIGGGLGGLLAIIGGILGLVAALSKKL
jgi:hypothetical protein